MIARQFARYFVVGSLAAGIHLFVLSVLIELAAVNPSVASSVGFVLACLFNYILQHYWVFDAIGSIKVFFPRYVLITSITFCLNLVLFYVFHEVMGLWYVTSQVLAIGLVFVVNFFLNRVYTFDVNHLV